MSEQQPEQVGADIIDEDQELAQAIALSLQQQQTGGGPGEDHHGAQEQTEEDELAQAMALSLQSHSSKRARRDPNAWVLAEPGTSMTTQLPPRVIGHVSRPALEVTHGSSLSLIATSTEVLNHEFSDADPEKDWGKWQKLGAILYFLAVFDPSVHPTEPISVLRLVLDGDFMSEADATPPRPRRRVVIDYLSTSEAARGRGLATRLIELAKKLAEAKGANCFVLALEESCPYWMSHGFVLEEPKAVTNKRLNMFPDTHLLRLTTNTPEELRAEDDQSTDDEDASESAGGDDDEESGDDAEDEDLQKALMLSARNAAGDGSGSGDAYEEDEDEDEDAALQRALLESMK